MDERQWDSGWNNVGLLIIFCLMGKGGKIHRKIDPTHCMFRFDRFFLPNQNINNKECKYNNVYFLVNKLDLLKKRIKHQENTT